MNTNICFCCGGALNKGNHGEGICRIVKFAALGSWNSVALRTILASPEVGADVKARAAKVLTNRERIYKRG